MNQIFLNILKGIAMGAANVVPGVSGGTIAFITGIFERLIHAIKSFFTRQTLMFLIKGHLRQWVRATDFWFLLQIATGILIALISLARLFDFLFHNYPVFIWSFFFGLVLASVFSISRNIDKWSIIIFFWYISGITAAVTLAMLTPASENQDTIYLFLCGVVASASMVLPGLSGSFVLVLMGNYELIMIRSVNELNLSVLIPVILGGFIGIVALSFILSWLFNRFKQQIISLLSGFILGSLLIIWPWKNIHYKVDKLTGEPLLNRSGEKIIEHYTWFLPSPDNQLILAILFIIAGALLVLGIEYIAHQHQKKINA